VHSVLFMGSPEPTHAEGVTAHLDRGIASLPAHRAYLKGLGHDVDARNFLVEMTTAPGRAIDARHSVAFEVASNVGV
jgi:hypothetical protein